MQREWHAVIGEKIEIRRRGEERERERKKDREREIGHKMVTEKEDITQNVWDIEILRI